jgi:hypothetical protein
MLRGYDTKGRGVRQKKLCAKTELVKITNKNGE